MQMQILRTEKTTTDSISVYFKRPENFKGFKPGQHGLFSFQINGASIARTYSFHTAPHEELLGITVRSVADGIVSNYLLNAKDSLTIDLQEVSGNFTIEPSSEIKRHLIMFAAGSGITPILSIIKSVLRDEPRSTISLIYSNKSYDRIIFKNELHQLEDRFPERIKIHHVLSQSENLPADFPVFYKGRLSPLITKKVIKGILAERDYRPEYFTCGPESFMDLVSTTVRAIGSGRPGVRKEVFFVPSKKMDFFDFSSLRDQEIIVDTNGEETLVIVKGGKSILQACLEQGIKLPFSCTEGQCGTCKARLISGEVKLRKNHILTGEELNQGQILLCQGFPLSDGVTIKTSL
jgi:ring-1,2-phenylacetyl-CoA epoxidase subunit PaaE